MQRDRRWGKTAMSGRRTHGQNRGPGGALVHVATNSFPMSDELKARILSTLLTLMNTRENLDRAVMRQSAQRRFVG